MQSSVDTKQSLGVLPRALRWDGWWLNLKILPSPKEISK
jgi:hypothetical protein